MKTFRKTLSVLLAVVMLMSVCSVLFTSVANAYTLTNAELLYLDFENERGIADVRSGAGTAWKTYYQTEGDNTYAVLWNKTSQGVVSTIGTENAVMTQSDVNTPHPDRFQVTEAGTYTITVKYKYLAGSSRTSASISDEGVLTYNTNPHALSFEIYKSCIAEPGSIPGKGGQQGAGVVSLDDDAYVEGVDYEVVTKTAASNADVEFEQYVLLKDTEWATVTKTFTFTEQNITDGLTSFGLAAANGSQAITGASSATSKGEIFLAVDDIVVIQTSSTTATTGDNGVTYVYDFKDADGTPYDSTYKNANHAFFSRSNSANNYASYIDQTTGYAVFTPTVGPAAVGGAGYTHELALKDPDFKLGTRDYLAAEAGNAYEMTVKYKLTDSSASSVNVGIGMNLRSTSASTPENDMSYTVVRETVAKSDTTTGEWQYITAYFDGDSTVTNSDTEYPVADAYLLVLANSQIVVAEVAVTVIDKSVYTESANNISVDFSNGYRDIYLPVTDQTRYNGGTLTTGTDPLNTGRGEVMIATATVKNNIGFGLPAAPGSGTHYSALSDTANKSTGFTIENGRTYQLKFDVYVDNLCTTDSDGIGNIHIYACNKENIACNSGVKINLRGTSYSNTTATEGWVTETYTFTTNDTRIGDTAPYFLFFFSCYAKEGDNAYSAKVYLDNMSVTDITDAADNDAENTKRSIRAEKGEGDNYVSAGIRFRGEIATATAEAADEVGFIVAPEALVDAYTGTDAWYTLTDGKAALDTAKVANATNVIYGTNGDNNQYQMIITKLTKEGETKNLLDEYFVVKMYVKTGDTIEYYNVETSSYNQVKNAYINNDASNAFKY